MTNLRNAKSAVLDLWRDLDAAAPEALADICAKRLDSSVVWRGAAPFGALAGPDTYAEAYLAPLKRALPGARRLTHMFFAGRSDGKLAGGGDGRTWVCGTGYLVGRPTGAFIGIPAVDQPIRVRWAEFLRFEGEAIVEIHTLLDFVDWFEQIGRPVLPRARGAAFVYPPPTAFDGRLMDSTDPDQSARLLEFSRRFLFGGLNAYDQSDLASMGVADFFHENVKWYGPGGIGACLSLEEFQELHQQPWLVAFPDRRVQDLDCLFAEGRLVGASAFAGVRATHAGPYLGVAATGRPIVVNGMDFWLLTGDRFTENWVFVDMPHLFAQFGVDLFDRMRRGGIRAAQGI